jgi:hypothetical protein
MKIERSKNMMMKKIVLLSLLLAVQTPISAYAGCAANDRICNESVNGQAAQQRQADQARTKQLNQQNGTSRYSGPTVGYQNGTPTIGYQKSIK